MAWADTIATYWGGVNSRKYKQTTSEGGEGDNDRFALAVAAAERTFLQVVGHAPSDPAHVSEMSAAVQFHLNLGKNTSNTQSSQELSNLKGILREARSRQITVGVGSSTLAPTAERSGQRPDFDRGTSPISTLVGGRNSSSGRPILSPVDEE